jgi:hypothetical protein
MAAHQQGHRDRAHHPAVTLRVMLDALGGGRSRWNAGRAGERQLRGAAVEAGHQFYMPEHLLGDPSSRS